MSAQQNGPSLKFLALVVVVICIGVAMYIKTQTFAHNSADVHGTTPVVGSSY